MGISRFEFCMLSPFLKLTSVIWSPHCFSFFLPKSKLVDWLEKWQVIGDWIASEKKINHKLKLVETCVIRNLFVETLQSCNLFPVPFISIKPSNGYFCHFVEILLFEPIKGRLKTVINIAMFNEELLQFQNANVRFGYR